jgi:hypothetical protein
MVPLQCAWRKGIRPSNDVPCCRLSRHPFSSLTQEADPRRKLGGQFVLSCFFRGCVVAKKDPYSADLG